MPDDKQNPKASDLLKALHALTLESEDDFRTKPIEEVRSELKQHGVDITPLKKQVSERIQKAKAENELRAAKVQREAALERFRHAGEQLKKIPAAIRERALSLLGNLCVTDPEAATAFFSKFEQASEADLQSLLDDLDFLEQQNEERDSPRS